MPSIDTRMTEMESGHFAGSLKVVDAAKQVANEHSLSSHFETYVDFASAHVPTGRWLDIGCGGGMLLGLAQRAGYKVEGIELTSDRLAAARDAGFTVHDSPVEDLAFDSDSFDVISLINVFSHLTDPASTIAELRRILKPGGIVVLATGEVMEGLLKSHVTRWNLGDHLYFLGEGTMQVYSANSGLKIVEHKQRWLPDELYSRQWLATQGVSRRRNILKKIILRTPGLFAIFRFALMKKNSGNKVYSATFALTKP